MSERGRHALIAATAGIVVAGVVTAVGVTQFRSSHRAILVGGPVSPVAPSFGNGRGFLGPPGGGPGLGGRPGGEFKGGGFFGSLSAAATYLGVDSTTLQSELESGKTLAQAAKDHGKSVDGLVSSMVAAQTKFLDAAVSSGRLTKEQEGMIASALEQRIKAIVNGIRTGPGFGGGFGRGGFGGPGNGFYGGSTGPA